MEVSNFDAVIWIIIGLCIYLIPSYIALQRQSLLTPAIFFLNLFFGWTLIVWIVCFVWACTTDK